MASALVNNVGVTPEIFLDCCPSSSSAAFSPFGWLSPRVSFSRDDDKEHGSPSKVKNTSIAAEEKKSGAGHGAESPSKDSVFDFEFRLDDPVTMLPADELFSDGKLLPLHLASIRANLGREGREVVKSTEVEDKKRGEVVALIDPYVFSPKAPRCSCRWRELLGLKKAAAAAASVKPSRNQKETLPAVIAPMTKVVTSHHHSFRGGALKHFLHRNPKKSSSNSDSSVLLPFLRDWDSETVTISARLSLSSSSSSGIDHDHDDLPRLSLDSDKPRNPGRLRLISRSQQRPLTDPIKHPLPDHPTVRVSRRAMADVAIPPRGASVDSPRMNSYGKIVFQSLERSSSSPSTFNGGPRLKHRGVERSYSANVRITPVLNVPVCSLRGSCKNVFGLGQLFSSSQKKDRNIGKSSGNGGGGRSHRQMREGITGN